MVVNINELVRELVNQKLYIPKISSGCKRHQVHFNEMVEEYRFMFPIIGFLASKNIEDCWFLN